MIHPIHKILFSSMFPRKSLMLNLLSCAGSIFKFNKKIKYLSSGCKTFFNNAYFNLLLLTTSYLYYFWFCS